MADDFNGLSLEDEATPAASADDFKGMSLEDETPETPEAPADDFEGLSLGDGAPEVKEDDAGPEDPKPDEVPDKYSFEDQDEEYNSAVGAVAKECGLSQEKAQKFVSAVESANMEFCAKQTQKWVAALKADKEVGGENFNSSVAMARRVFDKYVTEAEFRELMAYSGFTNHPGFVRMLVRIGKDLKMTGAARRPAFPHSVMEG